MRKQKKYSTKKSLFEIIMLLGSSIIILTILIPFYNMILLSITPENIYLKNEFIWFPIAITWDSFEYVFNYNAIWNGLLITIFITIIGVLINLFLTITAAYVLNCEFNGKKIYVILIIISMFFDGGLIANYLVVSNLGLTNNVFSMILPTGINFAYLLIMYKSFNTVPYSIIESAKLDGANEIIILLKIIVPISQPIIASLGLYYAVERWNEWYLGMLYINDLNLRPLQLILRGIMSNANSFGNTELAENLGVIPFATGIKMACTIIVMLPIVMVYPFLQKYFLEGLTSGSIKE
jgi:putative aldouronate transport system permease protein